MDLRYFGYFRDKMTNILLKSQERTKTKRSGNVESLGLGELSENEYELVGYQTEFSRMYRRVTPLDDILSQELYQFPWRPLVIYIC